MRGGHRVSVENKGSHVGVDSVFKVWAGVSHPVPWYGVLDARILVLLVREETEERSKVTVYDAIRLLPSHCSADFRCDAVEVGREVGWVVIGVHCG